MVKIFLSPSPSVVVSVILTTLMTIKVVSSACINDLSVVDNYKLEELKRQVRSFYKFIPDPSLDFAAPTPCSYKEGNEVAHPKYSVFTPAHTDPQLTTCPWRMSYTEDCNRYPCRIATAKLDITGNAITDLMRRPQPCLRSKNPSSRRRHRRLDGKLCEPLLQRVPVLERVSYTSRRGQHCVCNTLRQLCYCKSHTNIAVGYTCAFA